MADVSVVNESTEVRIGVLMEKEGEKGGDSCTTEGAAGGGNCAGRAQVRREVWCPSAEASCCPEVSVGMHTSNN